MNDSSVDSSEVSDFKEILSMTLSGQLPLLVGGHAVNLWAIVYRERVGRGLDRWLPLTSKDLDLVGMIDLLDCMKKNFGGDVRLSGPVALWLDNWLQTCMALIGKSLLLQMPSNAHLSTASSSIASGRANF